MAEELHNPGIDNLPAGKYQEVGPRGGKVPGGREIHIDKGDRLPPTKTKGHKWELVEYYTPGTDNLPAGKYEEVGPRGGKLPNAEVVHIDKGDRLPPTTAKGHKWKRIFTV